MDYSRSVADDEDGAATSTREVSGNKRFFFVHLQKTGGTSLFMRLTQVFTDAEVYPNSSDGDLFSGVPQFSIPCLTSRWIDRGDGIRLVFGHFPLCMTELLGGGFTTLTVLREPVERTLSY